MDFNDQNTQNNSLKHEKKVFLNNDENTQGVMYQQNYNMNIRYKYKECRGMTVRQ